jgi:hypothetical protein
MKIRLPKHIFSLTLCAATLSAAELTPTDTEPTIKRIPRRVTRQTPKAETMLQLDRHAFYDVKVQDTTIQYANKQTPGSVLIIMTNANESFRIYFNTSGANNWTNRFAFIERNLTRTSYTNFNIHLVGYGDNSKIASFSADLGDNGDKIRINVLP